METKYAYSVCVSPIRRTQTGLSVLRLLGFSRGAYTARALAGMLYKVVYYRSIPDFLMNDDSLQ
jgi:hypothetical protein